MSRAGKCVLTDNTGRKKSPSLRFGLFRDIDTALLYVFIFAILMIVCGLASEDRTRYKKLTEDNKALSLQVASLERRMQFWDQVAQAYKENKREEATLPKTVEQESVAKTIYRPLPDNTYPSKATSSSRRYFWRGNYYNDLESLPICDPASGSRPPYLPRSAYSPRVAENGSYYGEMSSSTNRPKTVHVNGYFRRDGTYVRGHYRSK